MSSFRRPMARFARPSSYLTLSFALSATVSLVGCSQEPPRAPTYPVRGAVKFNGQPTPGAFIVLHPKAPVDPPAPNPTGYVDAQGQFVLHTYGADDGAPEGEYDVTIRWQKPVEKDGELAPGPNVLPVQYANPQKSNITVQIAAGENQLPPIDIRR